MTVSTELTVKQPKMSSLVMFIAGNTVGAGILALPIMLGLVGFIPALIANCLLWLMMLFTGAMMARQNILQNPNIDLFTFFEIKFGKLGLFVITIAYLFLFYGLSIAYISGATTCILNFLPFHLSYYPVMISVFVFLFFILMNGMKLILKGNNIMMFLLFVSFLLILAKSLTAFDPSNLRYSDWNFLPATLPVLLCSFGFHNTIPIVAKALNGDYKRIFLTMFFGTFIPFILNILILVAVLGILSPSEGGDMSLISLFKKGIPATVPLSLKLHSNVFVICGFLFSILAIFTSYLAVAAGLLGFCNDFLSRIKKNFKYGNVILTFTIPFIIMILAQNLFLKAINFAAGIGAVIIFGIMPCLLAFKKEETTVTKLIGTTVLLLFLVIFGIELCQQVGLFKILPKIIRLA